MPAYSIEWIGAHPDNFWNGRFGLKPIAICHHVMDGGLKSTDYWFNDPYSKASTTFGIGFEAQIHQYVRLQDAPFANGVFEAPDLSLDWLKAAYYAGTNPNWITISIEFEGKPFQKFTQKQIDAAIWLDDLLCRQFTIPRDRQHLIGHYQISKWSRANCPSSTFPWNDLVDGVKAMSDGVDLPSNLAWKDEVTDFYVVEPFASFYIKNGGISIFGRPLSGYGPRLEFPGLYVQDFERARFEVKIAEVSMINPRIVLGRCNAELLNLKKK